MSAERKSAWDGYRRWRKIAWVVLPITIFLFASGATSLMALPLFVISATAVTSIQFFECPKCDEPFFYISGFCLKYSSLQFFPSSHPFTLKCVHCGFPKWKEPPPQVEKAELYPTPRRTDPRPDPAIAERLRLTNFLTLVLRDDPGAIGLRRDANGWVDVDTLLTRSGRCGIKLTRESIAEALNNSAPRRFEWDQAGNRIRAMTGDPVGHEI